MPIRKAAVGKSAAAEHLGIGLAKQGKTVLLSDIDSQTNLTASIGWKNADALKKTASDFLKHYARKSRAVRKHDSGMIAVRKKLVFSFRNQFIIRITERHNDDPQRPSGAVKQAE